MKRKKVLGLPYDSLAKEFVSIAFTYDSKYLIAIVGEPDWLMLYYNWEKGKVESQTRANNPSAIHGPVYQVSIAFFDFVYTLLFLIFNLFKRNQLDSGILVL